MVFDDDVCGEDGPVGENGPVGPVGFKGKSFKGVQGVRGKCVYNPHTPPIYFSWDTATQRGHLTAEPNPLQHPVAFRIA